MWTLSYLGRSLMKSSPGKLPVLKTTCSILPCLTTPGVADCSRFASGYLKHKERRIIEVAMPSYILNDC